MKLTEYDQALLNGEQGKAKQLESAMKLMVKAAQPASRGGSQ